MLPTSNHYSDIVSDIPSGSICGIFIYSDILSDNIWHSFWHILWHSIWHSIWHLYSDIFSGIYSDILSGILSGIYSHILSGIFSGIHSGICSDISGISSGILSDISSEILCGRGPGGTGGDHCDQELAVEVLQGPLRSRACSWSLAGTTLILGLLFGSGGDHYDRALAAEVRWRWRSTLVRTHLNDVWSGFLRPSVEFNRGIPVFWFARTCFWLLPWGFQSGPGSHKTLVVKAHFQGKQIRRAWRGTDNQARSDASKFLGGDRSRKTHTAVPSTRENLQDKSTGKIYGFTIKYKGVTVNLRCRYPAKKLIHYPFDIFPNYIPRMCLYLQKVGVSNYPSALKARPCHHGPSFCGYGMAGAANRLHKRSSGATNWTELGA